MEEKHIHRIRVRRGTNSQRKQVIFEDGELVYTKDNKKLYTGDSKNYGGMRVSNNSKVISTLKNVENVHAGDLLYNKLNGITYIVNNDDTTYKSIFYSSAILKKQLDELDYLLERLRKECCDTEFALVTDDNNIIVVDYGDWIKVKKDTSVPRVVCEIPNISNKFLNLKTNETYSLNIKNANSNPDILFFNNLIDEDTNQPPQNISIIKNSVTSSEIINIIEVTENTIKFNVNSLPVGVYVGIGVYINYNIINACGSIKEAKGVVNGLVYNSNVDFISVKIGTNEKYTSNKNYTLYKIIKSDTNQYPWEDEGWYIFYFSTGALPDGFYITMIDKTLNMDSGKSEFNKYIYGPIGPLSDDGYYLFWHPKNTDINIWNKGSGSSKWGVYRLHDTEEHTNSPKRYFIEQNKKPDINKIKNFLKEQSLDMVKDYTDIYKGNTVPSFIKIY